MHFITKLLLAIGILSVFHGTTDYFKAHAKETATNAGAAACDTMGAGDRSGGCGKSGQ